MQQTFNLAAGVRTQTPPAQLQTVVLTDLINHITADKMQMVENAAGKVFIQITNTKTKQYFSIGVSTKANNQDGTIAELLDNNIIYCGVSENGAWFSLSRPAVSNTPIETVDIAAFLAKSGKAATSTVG